MPVSIGDHANLWGLFRLGYGLGSRDEGELVAKTSCPFPAPGNPGRDVRPGLCLGPAKGTAPWNQPVGDCTTGLGFHSLIALVATLKG